MEFSNFKPRLSRILLFWVELQRQAVNDQYGETLKLSYQQYQLEHLMPQKWEKNWPLTAGISEEKREASLNMIGNFTLLKAKLNVLVGNSVWSDKVNGKIVKKKSYPGIKESSKLSISQEVISKKNWTEIEIEKRTAQLKKEIIAIWCPEYL